MSIENQAPINVDAQLETRGPLQILRDRLLLQEDLNFLLTNRVPRALLTRFMGWLSHIRQPTLTRLLINAWKLFSDLDLSDARQQHFQSLQECFTRSLRAGARPLDTDLQWLISPCDAIVGACGTVSETQVFQAKGFPYSIVDLFGGADAAVPFADGCYATLRLTSAMYHRFHAPHNVRVEHVRYVSGDTWNVNPIALRRIERLFCRNERAVIRMRLDSGHPLVMVPVAAILVASIRLHFLDVLFHLNWPGPNEIPCDIRVERGEELGWFEHGSTIIIFAPTGFKLSPDIETGRRLRMGQKLMWRPDK